MNQQICKLVINGLVVEVLVEPGDSLSEVLRNKLNLTGTKEGCGRGECGACTVLLDDKPVMACSTFVLECDGREIETIEGLATGENLHPLQQSFIDKAAVQCGFCTPGIIMSAKALYDNNEKVDEQEIREAIAGNHCRCTGYMKIVEAIMDAFDKKEDTS
jgi:aerobic carbon-monoxide dehydrogenase small subunit